MKYLPILMVFFSSSVLAQNHEDFYIVKEDGDTTFFEFTAHELENFNQKTTLILNHNSKNKKKKIKEYDVGDIKFYHSDTTYWVGFAKFYDQYFIALIARKRQIDESVNKPTKESNYELHNYEYRRIYYSEVTKISNTSLIAQDHYLRDWTYEVIKETTNSNKPLDSPR
ncbi:hypothetical protein AAOE16_01290 [Ekhidna sp. MALMAid0563]|uniref:hypothetical protein n=1 Tax=Ekhidna sp. MALMAid0563 TaxID=3143937 RepID=UPI0032E00D81